jgi:hypothetical protein
MSNPNRSDTPTTGDGAGARIYDADATTTKKGGVGVYDAPSRASSLPLGMIIGIIVALLVLGFIFFQFVF